MSPERERPKAPRPAHPRLRREPLPEHAPKPPSEDVHAPERLERLLRSPTYRRADEDPDFLHASDTRGVRLQLDYLKAQTLLERHGIERTLVVFGSTRIVEPVAAERHVAELRRLVGAHPGDADLRARLARAERIREKSRYYDVARAFGRLVAEESAKLGGHVAVVTGGGPGIMEAANRGAFDAGAETVGLNIDLPHEQYPNPYVTPELCFRFRYFSLRKLHFLLRARALVAFPGGYGTLDELFETLTLVQTRKIRPIPVVLVGEAYWARLVDFDFLVEEGTIAPEDRELFGWAETAQEIWSAIVRWYEESGEPFLGAGRGPAEE